MELIPQAEEQGKTREKVADLFTIIFKSGTYRQIATNRSKTVISETEFTKADLID